MLFDLTIQKCMKAGTGVLTLRERPAECWWCHCCFSAEKRSALVVDHGDGGKRQQRGAGVKVMFAAVSKGVVRESSAWKRALTLPSSVELAPVVCQLAILNDYPVTVLLR